MSETYIDVISQSILFKGIDILNIKSMMSCLEPKVNKYEKSDVISMAGESLNCLGIILEGEATVIKESAAGTRVIMTILKPGDIFGEIAVFSNNSEWPASVLANDLCMVMFLDKCKIIGECSKICTWHRELIQNMLKVVCDKAMLLNKKVEYLTIKSMRAKLCTFLLEQYKKSGKTTFMLPMMRNELADFLNVSRPSMSREMCRMRDEGIIEFYKSSIQIKNLEALKKMTDL